MKGATRLRVIDGEAEARAQQNRVAKERAATEAELAEARGQIETEQRAVADAEQRVRDTEGMHQAIELVAGLASRLAPELNALVALDRQASEIVDRLADAIVEGQDTFMLAAELAERLEQPATVQRQIVRPTLSWAAQLARIAIAKDRHEGRRDLANGWLEAATEKEMEK